MTDTQTDIPITKGCQQLIAGAVAEIETYPAPAAIERFDDEDVVFVDVCDATEIQEHGQIPGSIHASRGMLEFHIDPESAYFIEEFGADKEFVFYCAVGARCPARKGDGARLSLEH